MSEIYATVAKQAREYTRKKDGKLGTILAVILDGEETETPIYGRENDPILMPRQVGEIVMVKKDNNFYSLISVMAEDGSFVSVNNLKQQTQNEQPDNETIKKQIRWYAKILDYCYEQSPNHGDIIFTQACKKFNL